MRLFGELIGACLLWGVLLYLSYPGSFNGVPWWVFAVLLVASVLVAIYADNKRKERE